MQNESLERKKVDREYFENLEMEKRHTLQLHQKEVSSLSTALASYSLETILQSLSHSSDVTGLKS